MHIIRKVAEETRPPSPPPPAVTNRRVSVYLRCDVAVAAVRQQEDGLLRRRFSDDAPNAGPQAIPNVRLCGPARLAGAGGQRPKVAGVRPYGDWAVRRIGLQMLEHDDAGDENGEL